MNRKRILFCSAHPLDRKLGSSKVIMELADEMVKLGWQCRLASDKEICSQIDNVPPEKRFLVFKDFLATFILKNVSEFDVVEYDHICLPFSRTRFPIDKLFVARSVLLAHHFEKITLPRFKGAKSFLGNLINGPIRRARLKQDILNANTTLSEADLINVSNKDDKTELVSRGFDSNKIIVIPYGLSHERFAQFNSVIKPTGTFKPTVAFIGTFDTRKGGRELPEILRNLKGSIPEVRLKLLGARYRSEKEVLSYFPRDLHENLEIISQFDPQDLPQHLSSCSVGIFPSYIEGFGFAVLEMLTAGLPVIAYNAPGPTMMLTENYLVTRGDYKALSKKIIDLLKNPETLKTSREWALTRAKDFRWDALAQQTSDIYLEKLNELRQKGHL